MKLTDPIPLAVDWSKVFKRTALTLVIMTVLAALSRARSLLIVADVIDVVVIVLLLLVAAYAWLRSHTS